MHSVQTKRPDELVRVPDMYSQAITELDQSVESHCYFRFIKSLLQLFDFIQIRTLIRRLNQLNANRFMSLIVSDSTSNRLTKTTDALINRRISDQLRNKKREGERMSFGRRK
jgi:hypothetical protein